MLPKITFDSHYLQPSQGCSLMVVLTSSASIDRPQGGVRKLVFCLMKTDQGIGKPSRLMKRYEYNSQAIRYVGRQAR
jgi:hypothetical protein